MNTFDIDNLDDLDSDISDQDFFAWLTIRILSINEDSVIAAFWERIKHNGLEERIKEIVVLKEHKIEESKEYSPTSEELPQRGLKKGKNSVWIKNSRGNYQKIRVVEKRPFKGMAFIKMAYDFELFRTLKSWEKTIYFLGDPTPQVMSESDFKKMESSLSKEFPDLEKYVEEKKYVLVEGKLKDVESVKPIFIEEENFDDDEEQTDTFSKQSHVDEKTKDEHASSFSKTTSKNKFVDIQKLKVNDLVYVDDFGSQGQIQSINLETNEIVVVIQAFGRRQPIVCQPSQLSEI